MKRLECRSHIWLITSRGESRGEATVRVKCWRCFKRMRWKAFRSPQAEGIWREWEKHSRNAP